MPSSKVVDMCYSEPALHLRSARHIDYEQLTKSHENDDIELDEHLLVVEMSDKFFTAINQLVLPFREFQLAEMDNCLYYRSQQTFIIISLMHSSWTADWLQIPA